MGVNRSLKFIADMQDGGFVIVKSRRRKNTKSTLNANSTKAVLKQGQTGIYINEDLAIKKVLSAKAALVGTQFLDETKASILKALQFLPEQIVYEIVCYGLGHFTECHIARYQLALLLLIKEWFNASAYIHDPVFYRTEVKLLESNFGLNIIPGNEEGKRKLKTGASTLLYFPHCSKQLTNNFLWCNWGPELENCIVFGNSFSSILTSELSSNNRLSTCYIQRINPYTNELALDNNFKHQDIFNNTSIHTFPRNELSTLEQGFWEDHEEPKYGVTDTEFITNQ